jgi:hypothetical protein
VARRKLFLSLHQNTKKNLKRKNRIRKERMKFEGVLRGCDFLPPVIRI